EYLVTVSAADDDLRLRLAALQGSVRGMARRKVDLAKEFSPATIKLLREQLSVVAAEPTQEIAIRRDAIEILGYLPNSTSQIAQLASGKWEQSISLAAIGALARQPGKEHWESQLAGFASDTPPVRRAIVEGLLANAERTTLLLDAIEAGRIKPNELDLQQAKRL